MSVARFRGLEIDTEGQMVTGYKRYFKFGCSSKINSALHVPRLFQPKHRCWRCVVARRASSLFSRRLSGAIPMVRNPRRLCFRRNHLVLSLMIPAETSSSVRVSGGIAALNPRLQMDYPLAGKGFLVVGCRFSVFSFQFLVVRGCRCWGECGKARKKCVNLQQRLLNIISD